MIVILTTGEKYEVQGDIGFGFADSGFVGSTPRREIVQFFDAAGAHHVVKVRDIARIAQR